MNAFTALVRRAWPVLLSYGVFSVWGLMCLFMSIALSAKTGLSLGPEGIAAAMAILIAVVVGHVLGNLLALARLRLLAIALVFTVAFFVATLAVGTLGALGGFVIIGVVAAISGYLGIASRLDVMASWFPLSMSVGGAIIWMNTHGQVATFKSGAKHAMWDPFSLICVAGGIFLLLVFLATRHAFSLSVWQELDQRRAGEAAAPNTGQRVRTPVRAGRGSVVVIFGFTAVVLLIAALLSPYLFRTRETDKGTPSDGQQTSETKPNKPSKPNKGKGKGKGKAKGKSKHGQGQGNGQGSGNGDGQGNGEGQGDGQGGEGEGENENPNQPDTENARRAAQAAMQLAFEILKWLLIAALIALILFLVLLPPFRRRMLLKHLEKPMWPVAPTARVMNLWRRAVAALADADIVPEAGETPTELAQRAERELREIGITNVTGLHDAARTVERIDYAGRGLGKDDEEAVKRAVLEFVRTVNEHLPFKKKLAAQWTRTPEVEA